MIIHALHVLRQELNTFLNSFNNEADEDVLLGNIAQLDLAEQGNSNVLRNKIVITLINIREEKALKNGPFSRRNDATLRTEYFNPPVYLNMYLLFTASHRSYNNALVFLSRTVSFFQSKNAFTQENTQPVVSDSDVPASERMDEFKLILELYSPNFEEENHIWGTLGGKQMPSVIYIARLVEVKRAIEPTTGGLVEEIKLNLGLKMQ